MLPHRDLDTLRGIEGARVKAVYRMMAKIKQVLRTEEGDGAGSGRNA